MRKVDALAVVAERGCGIGAINMNSMKTLVSFQQNPSTYEKLN
jgi:hypothetical protein